MRQKVRRQKKKVEKFALLLLPVSWCLWKTGLAFDWKEEN